MKPARMSYAAALGGLAPRVSAFSLVALVSLASCSSATPASDNGKTVDVQKQVSMLAEIGQLIGDAKCGSDQQCRVAGIGALSCGGPESYRAWSTASTDAKKLTRLLEAYATERQRFNEAAGLMATCEVKPAPAARCERTGTAPGKCVLSGLASDQR